MRVGRRDEGQGLGNAAFMPRYHAGAVACLPHHRKHADTLDAKADDIDPSARNVE